MPVWLTIVRSSGENQGPQAAYVKYFLSKGIFSASSDGSFLLMSFRIFTLDISEVLSGILIL